MVDPLYIMGASQSSKQKWPTVNNMHVGEGVTRLIQLEIFISKKHGTGIIYYRHLLISKIHNPWGLHEYLEYSCAWLHAIKKKSDDPFGLDIRLIRGDICWYQSSCVVTVSNYTGVCIYFHNNEEIHIGPLY